MSLLSPTALSTCVREVVAFVDDAGWDQPPQLFALVPTAELLEREPDLAEGLSSDSELTPVAQEPLPGGTEGGSPELDEALAGITWPEAVAGCVLVQEILILPPEAEAELDEVTEQTADEAEAERVALQLASEHPERQEARLVAAVLRGGESLCLLQLRPDAAQLAADPDAEPELLEHPELAPNLVAALHATLDE